MRNLRTCWFLFSKLTYTYSTRCNSCKASRFCILRWRKSCHKKKKEKKKKKKKKKRETKVWIPIRFSQPKCSQSVVMFLWCAFVVIVLCCDKRYNASKGTLFVTAIKYMKNAGTIKKDNEFYLYICRDRINSFLLIAWVYSQRFLLRMQIFQQLDCSHAHGMSKRFPWWLLWPAQRSWRVIMFLPCPSGLRPSGGLKKKYGLKTRFRGFWVCFGCFWRFRLLSVRAVDGQCFVQRTCPRGLRFRTWNQFEMNEYILKLCTSYFLDVRLDRRSVWERSELRLFNM